MTPLSILNNKVQKKGATQASRWVAQKGGGLLCPAQPLCLVVEVHLVIDVLGFGWTVWFNPSPILDICNQVWGSSSVFLPHMELVGGGDLKVDLVILLAHTQTLLSHAASCYKCVCCNQ